MRGRSTPLGSEQGGNEFHSSLGTLNRPLGSNVNLPLGICGAPPSAEADPRRDCDGPRYGGPRPESHGEAASTLCVAYTEAPATHRGHLRIERAGSRGDRAARTLANRTFANVTRAQSYYLASITFGPVMAKQLETFDMSASNTTTGLNGGSGTVILTDSGKDAQVTLDLQSVPGVAVRGTATCTHVLRF